MLLTTKAQKNPAALLAILLAAHMIVVSLNRAPGPSAGRRYLQIWVMTALMPAQWATSTIASSVSRAWDNYFSLRDARLENEQLRTERATLQTELAAAQERVRISEQVAALEQWGTAQNYPLAVARVIARDANQWFNSVVIDRGTISGIVKDQPVVTPEGLVGRVIFAGPVSSRVLLITDERHGAGAIIGQLAEARELVVVKGRSAERCEIRFFAAPEKITPDEVVLTSGQDGIYPKGLVIGRIRESGAPGAMTVEVVPAAPLNRLDLVGVLRIPPGSVRARVEELEEAEKKTERQGSASERRRP